MSNPADAFRAYMEALNRGDDETAARWAQHPAVQNQITDGQVVSETEVGWWGWDPDTGERRYFESPPDQYNH